MGREDYSESTRKKFEELPAFPKDRYLINLDHSPYITEETAALAPDLQLSGHTHAGQFFPLRSIYIPVVTYVYGDHEIKSGHLYVSAGISGWYISGRTEAHCTYEVIHLNKA